MTSNSARLLSVNAGRPRVIGHRRGAPVLSSIAKAPITGRVRIEGVNVAGDDQADRRVHGGPDKAVYAYAAEDSSWWAAQLGGELAPGAFGENLTTTGVDCTRAVIGERWRIGSTRLEVCQPRFPCFKLGLHFGDPRMVKRFAEASRPGAYLRVVHEGELGAGDRVEVLDRPDHEVTIGMVFDAVLHDLGLVPRTLTAPQLPPDLREWMAERAEAAARR